MISPATIACALIFATISAYLAQKSHKNPYLWFMIGFLFGIIGLFAIFFLPMKKKKRVVRQRKPLPLLRGPQDKFWYYLDGSNDQIGPMSYQAFLEKVHSGSISKNTYVWNESEEDWKKLEEIIIKKPSMKL